MSGGRRVTRPTPQGEGSGAASPLAPSRAPPPHTHTPSICLRRGGGRQLSPVLRGQGERSLHREKLTGPIPSWPYTVHRCPAAHGNLNPLLFLHHCPEFPPPPPRFRISKGQGVCVCPPPPKHTFPIRLHCFSVFVWRMCFVHSSYSSPSASRCLVESRVSSR